MDTWIWIVLIVLILVVIIALTIVVCLLLRRSRSKECHKGECCQENGKSTVAVKLPLPTPQDQDMENSMEPTQHSDTELPSRGGVSSKSEPFQSLRKEASKSEHLPIRPSRRIRKNTTETMKNSRSPHQRPGFNEDTFSSLTSSCAQHSTEKHHVLNTHPACTNGTRPSSSATCSGPSGPVSAGCTPRYARKIPACHPAVPHDQSPLDTPTKNVATAHEISDTHPPSPAHAVRSEMVSNFVGEEAGRTPIQLSPHLDGRKTTEDQSRLTTWTPTKRSSGSPVVGNSI